MENRALGKGLTALIPEQSSRNDSVKTVKTSLVKENSLQPRSVYDEEKLEELKSSIKEDGILQPILVRKIGEGFEVIAGERRLRAAKSLGLEEIPVTIREATDRQALVLALVENIQREELNAIEEAQAFQKLINDFEFTQEHVAKSVGKNRSTISNMLRLLKLPVDIQKSLFDGLISEGHARALLGVEDSNLQNEIYQKVILHKLSVRETEHLVKRGKANVQTNPKKEKESKSSDIVAVEEELQRIIGTKVRIKSNKQKGSLVIDFYSYEDLNRIIETIKK